MNIKMLLIALGVIVFAALFVAGFLWWRPDSSGMKAMIQLVRTRFPSVRQITPEELDRRLNDPTQTRPLLLDVRTPEEYAISHLAGARRVDPDATADEVLPLVGPDRPVVVYCSVGYRSSQLAQRLQRAGFTDVANLEGSIFAWANEGRPLERDGQTTDRVHPYNQTFGKLLTSKHRADLTADSAARRPSP